MKKVCFAAEMRQMDKSASEDGGVSGIVLMENAAIAVVNVLKEKFGDLKDKRIGIFCGKGNNGGDGFAAARHLINLGARVGIFLVCGEDFSPDAKNNYNIVKRMCADIKDISENADVSEDYIASCDIVIDAVYGTGIHGTVPAVAREVIERINRSSKYTVAVDIPSGVNADTGEICGACIKAHTTVTFAEYKMGMFLFDGADYMGEIVCADISIPKYIVDAQNIRASVTDDEFVRENFPKRKNNSHKGDYGKVFIVGGSAGMTGAAYMASQAALVTGSGLITLGIAESLNPIMENKLTEVMTLPLADNGGNIVSGCADVIVERMNKSDVILFGCGIGRGAEVKEILGKILREAKVPVIIDADGLYALDTAMLEKSSAEIVITPHNAELARLIGKMPEEKERPRLCREFAQRYNVTLILKGHYTVVTDKDGTQYINTTGNSGMSTGGSGDVLAGMVASIVGRGTKCAVAAAMAVYLHGRAADIAAEKTGENSLTPTDIIEGIPTAVKTTVGV